MIKVQRNYFLLYVKCPYLLLKNRCLTWEFITKHESTQLWCVWPTPALDRKVPLLTAAQCAFDIPFISLFAFSPPKVHLLYSVRKRSVRKSRKLTSTSSWPKATGKNLYMFEYLKRRKSNNFLWLSLLIISNHPFAFLQTLSRYLVSWFSVY